MAGHEIELRSLPDRLGEEVMCRSLLEGQFAVSKLPLVQKSLARDLPEWQAFPTNSRSLNFRPPR